jgi:hypothetical protein
MTVCFAQRQLFVIVGPTPNIKQSLPLKVAEFIIVAMLDVIEWLI